MITKDPIRILNIQLNQICKLEQGNIEVGKWKECKKFDEDKMI